MGLLRILNPEKKRQDVTYAAVELDPRRSDSDTADQQTTVEGWPTAPERISSASIWVVGDIVLLLMPIAFIVLAALAYELDGKPLSPHGERIQDLILLGPTLFPLAFAALAGRSLKKIALWKAERGTTLGLLEHIIGSQSLVSAVGHAITLHSLNFLTLGLLFLWALSPLGGQSALRLVHRTNSTIADISPIFYSNVNAGSTMPEEPLNEDSVSRAEAILMTSLMTADTLEFASPLDTWNHPKIPRIDALEQDVAKNSTDLQWFNVEKKVNQTYASLTGVNVLGLKDGTHANFTIPYEYLYFDCGLHPSTNATNNIKSLAYLNELQKANRLQSGSQFYTNMSTYQFMGRGFFLWGVGNGITVEKLLYGTEFFQGSLWLFECSMNSVLLEANVECSSDACEAKRLRRLLTPRNEREGRYLPYDVIRDWYTFKYFITGLNPLGGNASLYMPNPINAYLYGNEPWGKDPLTNMAPARNWTQYIDDPHRSIEMSQRLTRFLNSYWDATRWPLTIARNDPYAKSSLNQTSGEPPSLLKMNKTEAVVSHQAPHYQADVAWVTILIACSCILLLLGIASVILSLRITAPDVFNYVSSLTRNNPYVNLPVGGSGLDGATRALLLRKLPVQLGDVKPNAEAGYIALRSVGQGSDAQLSRIRRDRFYQ